MYVKVRVYPGAKKEKVTKVHDTQFEIVVREPAAGNAANGRVRALLAAEFGLPIAQVRMVTGHRSPSKIFDVTLVA